MKEREDDCGMYRYSGDGKLDDVVEHGCGGGLEGVKHD